MSIFLYAWHGVRTRAMSAPGEAELQSLWGGLLAW
jgi:hypothetical protein